MGWASDALHNDIMRYGRGLIATGGLTVHTSEGTTSRSGFTPHSNSRKSYKFERTKTIASKYSELECKLKSIELTEEHKSVILNVMKHYYSVNNIKRKRSARASTAYRYNLKRLVDNSMMKSINMDTGEYETITEHQLDAIRCIYYWTYSPVYLNNYDYSKYKLKDKYLRYAMPLVHTISECEDLGIEFNVDTYMRMYINNKYKLL